ncbi:hypothetical protein QQX98_012205 [Neonectria punicea]|uniref:Centrosomin N-terminal motif 1 domain-containing protein n=1 Tax=Neonectria punicea TaxID=979145 RepID=A0ABR1GJK8_9HYPO
MEPSQAHPYDRSRPSYPRTASRSSTSTTNTRVTSQSTNSSMSQTDPSVPHPAHRFHHAACKSTSNSRTTPRATPHLSREASNESTRQTAVSSFLQERLRKERQVESDKVAAWSRGNSDLSVSVDLNRSIHGSPTKNRDPDHRPQSTSTNGTEPGKKQGLGVKDMEQVISSLHKQNFDLKLELFHRRERQTMMEDRIEGLESEKTRAEEMNEQLLLELEKRDKAVEEAVAMIVTLEAKLEQYAKERGMVQQLEAEGLFGLRDFGSTYEHPAPHLQGPDLAKLEDDAKAISRMPSFLSERSGNTENLRNVYLGVRGSVLSLRQAPEGAYGDKSPANGLASPNLSVLSESSFVSVYGQKGYGNTVPLEVDEPLSLDGADSLPGKASVIKRPKTSMARTLPSTRTARSNSLTGNNRRKDHQSITQAIDVGSPLQKIERLDPTYSQKKAENRPENRSESRNRDAGSGFGSRPANPPSQSPGNSPARRRARAEKRESLRRVLTDAPGGVRLHDLPPTPDTISSSTLRRFQNSNDTLSKQSGLNGQRSYDDLSDASDDERHSEGAPLGVIESAAKPLEKARDLNNSAYFEARARAIQRPRSADETTVSNRRPNDWDSDDDSDARSLQSSLDIWMRESSKPTATGRASPDLFSFPTTASKGDWAVDAMFAHKNLQSGGVSTSIDPERAADLFPAQQELFTASLPPPPPNRRSSLLAQTGNSPVSSRPSTKRDVSKPGRRNLYHRRNSDDIQMRAEMQTPVQQLQQPPPQPTGEQKKNYPPITGHQAARNPLTKLFRRSIGGTPSATPEPVTTEVASEAPKTNAGMGVPSWVGRSSAVEDDRDGATPPPIMRNPRQSRRVSADLNVLVGAAPQDPSMPATPTMPGFYGESSTPENHPGNSPRVSSAMGHRRKWLPGFRAASFKARNG